VRGCIVDIGDEVKNVVGGLVKLWSSEGYEVIISLGVESICVINCNVY
jgi:hypothetical protein